MDGKSHERAVCSTTTLLLLLLVTSLPPSTTFTPTSLSSPFSNHPLTWHPASRDSRHVHSPCYVCLSTYLYDSCSRCLRSTYALASYAQRVNNDHSVGQESGFEPLARWRRDNGCGCCFHSRFTNGLCCNICSRGAKRAVGSWRTAQRPARAPPLAEGVPRRPHTLRPWGRLSYF